LSDESELLDVISTRLKQREHRNILKNLVDAYSEGGTEGIETKIREMLDKIEEV
jgi:hypothetical protein